MNNTHGFMETFDWNINNICKKKRLHTKNYV